MAASFSRVGDLTIQNPSADAAGDLGEYCRRVEEHLTKENEGHLVRIVGPGFELVRRWAEAGIPLNIVYRGISLKAERHRAGRSRRPLRLEFCEADVQATYDSWRRAVGLVGHDAVREGAEPAPPARSRKPSLTRTLDRGVDRLSHFLGRLDLDDDVRSAAAAIVDRAAGLRDEASRLRGDARDALAPRLAELDIDVSTLATRVVAPDELARLRSEAEHDLVPFRDRLSRDDWERSVRLTTDRLLRERLRLPTFEPEA